MKKLIYILTPISFLVISGCKIDHDQKKSFEINYLSINDNKQTLTINNSESNLSIEKEIYWTDIKSQIIDNHCIICHSPPPADPTSDNISTMEAGLDLTNLDVVRANASKIFARVIIDKDMPLSPYPQLEKEEKEMITKWIIDGMKEN